MPANQTIPSFDNVTLTCRRATVTEVTSLLTTYSWHRVDGVIPTKAVGEHSEKLVIPSVVAADEGQYYCITEMFGHCAKSNSATVNVDGEEIAGMVLVNWLVQFGPDHPLLSQV